MRERTAHGFVASTRLRMTELRKIARMDVSKDVKSTIRAGRTSLPIKAEKKDRRQVANQERSRIERIPTKVSFTGERQRQETNELVKSHSPDRKSHTNVSWNSISWNSIDIRCATLTTGLDAPLHPRRRPLEQAHILVDVGVEQPLGHRLASLDALVVCERPPKRWKSASRKTGMNEEGSRWANSRLSTNPMLFSPRCVRRLPSVATMRWTGQSPPFEYSARRLNPGDVERSVRSRRCTKKVRGHAQR